MELDNGNFIVIQSWMVTELNLKGNELMVYAIIYGFSQAKGWYSGSIKYLMEWTNTTKQTVINTLKSLISKDLLERVETEKNGVKFFDYRSKIYTGGGKKILPGGKKFLPGGQKILPGEVKNFDQGGKKFLPHNIDNNIDTKDIDNIDSKDRDKVKKEKQSAKADCKKKSKKKDEEEEKFPHGTFQNVELTDAEFVRLANDYGEEVRDECIEYLSAYMKEYPKSRAATTSKSHNLTIRRWVIDEVNEKRRKRARARPKESEFAKAMREIMEENA